MTTERPLVMAKMLVWRRCDTYPTSIIADDPYRPNAVFGRIWIEGYTIRVVFNQIIDGGAVKSPQFDNVESAKEWMESQNQKKWLSITEVPELAWRDSDANLGYWYSGNYGIERNQLGENEIECLAWYESGNGESRDIGCFTSLLDAQAACGHDNRRLVLGTTETTT